MKTPTLRRHVLVVAPQCLDLGPLDELEEVAESLHGLLLDQRRGACGESSDSEPSLLYGQSLRPVQIETAIRGAAERAGRAGAVLVLVLLGYGIAPGRNSPLYLMAGNSRADEIDTAVNVGALLTQVLRTPGLPGVFALVEVCRPDGAGPGPGGTDGGVCKGSARLSMIMREGAARKASELAFSKAVVQLLTEGIVGAGEFLRSDAVLGAVCGALPGTVPYEVEHVGTQGASGSGSRATRTVRRGPYRCWDPWRPSRWIRRWPPWGVRSC